MTGRPCGMCHFRKCLPHGTGRASSMFHMQRNIFEGITMRQQITHRILYIFGLALASAIVASAQASASGNVLTLNPDNSWQGAVQWIGSSRGKLVRKIVIVTLDQPLRRQSCRIQSFTSEKLVCSRVLGDARIFLPSQVLALIVPGDDVARLKFVLGFNAGLGVAIWGTVVLAATCAPCAVATGIAAFFFFGAAGASMIGDGQPDRVLYLASRKELSPKLGYLEYREP